MSDPIYRATLADALADVEYAVEATLTLNASVAELIAAAKRFGLEGIVAKRRDSRWEPGRSTGAWVKCRVSPGQEFVIGGYLPGSRVFDAFARRVLG